MEFNNIDISQDVVLREKGIRNAISVVETEMQCENIYQLIEEFLNENDSVIFYEAIGMPDNIENIIEMLNYSKYAYEENDKDKFFIRDYPRLISIISNREELRQVIDEWNCTIYELRNFIIIKSDVGLNLEKMIKLRSRDILLKYDVKCSICNEPESPYHNTFLIYYKDELKKKMMKIFGKC